MRLLNLSTPVILVLLNLSSSPLLAQRTAQRQPFVGISQGTVLSPSLCGEITLSAGHYFSRGLGILQADFTDMTFNVHTIEGISTGRRSDRLLYTFNLGYMERVLSNRSRSFSLYAGAGLLLGGRSSEVLLPLPEELEGSLPKNELLYGAYPEISLEAFLSKRTALVLSVNSPIVFGSTDSSGDFLVRPNIGIRYNILQ